MTQSRPKKRGQILVQVIVFGAIAVYIASALVNWAVTNIRETSWAYDKERALQIAEVGVEYYRWHLAHAPTDFRDGTSQAGPYVHNFYDKDGNLIGHFSLNITPPPVGSSLVTVDSVGTVTTNAAVSRTIEAKLAKPSIAKYAVIANDVMRFGVGTEVFGLIHSNKGIHFDGLAHNLVTSAVASYTDPDYTGGPEFGVYTRVSPVDPLPPAAVPVRTDVFQVGRQFPVPAVDFGGITVDLAQMKSEIGRASCRERV
jgi:hypothetical protein